MAVDQVTRCDRCGGTHVPTLSAVAALLDQNPAPIVCMCESCCGETVRAAAGLLEQLGVELGEAVRARIAGQAKMLRESGVVLRAIHIPRTPRTAALTSVVSN